MTRLFGGRPVVRWLALAFAVLAVLSHVCVLPHEAHAVTAEPSAHHDGPDGHAQHDALHATSCEAVAAPVTSPATPLPADGHAIATAAVPAASGIHTPRTFATPTSPPLFLLHSAFRI